MDAVTTTKAIEDRHETSFSGRQERKHPSFADISSDTCVAAAQNYSNTNPLAPAPPPLRMSFSRAFSQDSATADAVDPTLASVASTPKAVTASAATPCRPSFDATVMGLGELRTAAHTNAKQPLYNFLARCSGAERRVGDAEYWRGVVETWCAERNMGPVDLSTKQVSLYLRQMAQVRPTVSCGGGRWGGGWGGGV